MSQDKVSYPQPLPEEVVALRERHGLTQTEAAERWMTTINTVKKWESPLESGNNRRVHPLMWWAMRRILGDKG
ncbi:MAG: XRE family transcriptional regulator [Gammaproteobacteria bacterium]|jgi:DNA-binding transcriptional regulator YiaG|nr:XRE family transcriptional regulator [Sideroxydans sp.]MBU4046799.1 XRE family transcriptional regulator [Gammaproteobacteria bacterium]MBU4150718.1 XRE family transcriptional regulator [Gammaproteobacteria bacterium]